MCHLSSIVGHQMLLVPDHAYRSGFLRLYASLRTKDAVTTPAQFLHLELKTVDMCAE